VSQYPCDRHGQRIRGSLDGLYLTQYLGDASYFRKLRLCGPCLVAFSEMWAERFCDPTEPVCDLESPVCGTPGCDRRGPDQVHRFSAAFFVHGQDPERAHAHFCDEHALATVRQLALEPDEPAPSIDLKMTLQRGREGLSDEKRPNSHLAW
jgi:hypothetical protein